jgi:hypothetical protein
MKPGMTLLGAGLLVMPLFAQTPTADPLLRWMDQIAQGQLDGRDKEIAAVRTVADAERRKEVVRWKIMSLWEDCRTTTGLSTPGLPAGFRRTVM